MSMRWLLFLCFIFVSSVQAQSVSVKNFREILTSLETSLNLKVSPVHSLYKVYSQVMESLPASGDVKEYNASMQWNLMRLTAEFCKERVQLDLKVAPNQRWIHKKIDENLSPKEQKELAYLFQEYSEVFWQRGLKTQEETALTKFANELAGDLVDNKSSTPVFLTTLCTATGMSSDSVAIY